MTVVGEKTNEQSRMNHDDDEGESTTMRETRTKTRVKNDEAINNNNCGIMRDVFNTSFSSLLDNYSIFCKLIERVPLTPQVCP